MVWLTSWLSRCEAWLIHVELPYTQPAASRPMYVSTPWFQAPGSLFGLVSQVPCAAMAARTHDRFRDRWSMHVKVVARWPAYMPVQASAGRGPPPGGLSCAKSAAIALARTSMSPSVEG